MATRETRQQRGSRQGDALTRRLILGLRDARLHSGVSQRQVARLVRCSQSEISRLERTEFLDVPIWRLSEIACVLGFELSASLHIVGQPLRDKGHQELIRRFLAALAVTWNALREVPLPLPGDRRSWDVLLRLASQRVGVEAETRLRDVQAFVRRVRERERDGGVDEILVVLADTAHNRSIVGDLRDALGPRFITSPRAILGALRSGQPLPGSGVILL